MNKNWLRCAQYGRVDINPRNGDVKLYYTQFDYQLLMYPRFIKATSAIWQGNNIIVNGYNTHGAPVTVLMTDFFNFQRIH